MGKNNATFLKVCGPQGYPGPQGPYGPQGVDGPIGPTGKRGSKWFVGQDCQSAPTGPEVCVGDMFLNLDGCGICEFTGGVTGWLDTGKNLSCIEFDDVLGALKQIPKIGGGGESGPTGNCIAQFTIFECADMFKNAPVDFELLQLGDTMFAGLGMFSNIDQFITIMDGLLWSHVEGPMGSHYFFKQTMIVGDPDSSVVVFRDSRGVVTMPDIAVECFEAGCDDCVSIKNGSQVLICKNGKFYFVDLDCIFGFDFQAKDAGGCTTMVLNPLDVNHSLTVGPANAGDGFLSVTCPDGSNIGGDCRGENAVDLQRIRSEPGEVALGPRSFLAGGQANLVALEAEDGAVVAGVSNRVIGGVGNLILGGKDNEIGPTGNYGAILAGTSNTLSTTASDKNVIVGGRRNVLQGTSEDSVIMGGKLHIVTDCESVGIFAGSRSEITSDAIESAIVGGESNIIENSDDSLIGGGYANNISDTADQSAIIGGLFNSMEETDNSAILAGYYNSISDSSSESVILAGSDNSISDSSDKCGILAGSDNSISNSSRYSGILLGEDNSIRGIYGDSPGSRFRNCAVIGGNFHDICLEDSSSSVLSNHTIVGGARHDISIQNSNESDLTNNVILGGDYHTMDISDSQSSDIRLGVIFGGLDHEIKIDNSNNFCKNNYNAIIAGKYHQITIFGSANFSIDSNGILGGSNNEIYVKSTMNGFALNNSIIGGNNNEISLCDSGSGCINDSVIIGGSNNEIYIDSGDQSKVYQSVIIGGDSNSIYADQYEETIGSVIVGGSNNKIANYSHSVVIGGTGMMSTANNEISVGGTLRIKEVPETLASNMLVWDNATKLVTRVSGGTFVSDERLKRDITDLDNKAFNLDNLEKVRLISYRKKKHGVESRVKHGFSAQNLKEIIPWVVKNGGKISGFEDIDNLLKIDQMALIAYLVGICKEQQKLIKSGENENNEMKIRNENLEARVEKLETQLSNLLQKISN